VGVGFEDCCNNDCPAVALERRPRARQGLAGTRLPRREWLSMKKPYDSHELEYRRMKKKGVRSWDERPGSHAPKTRNGIEVNTVRFLNDALAQPWAPNGGKAIELGCGTGPILRHLCKKGFSGLGVDVSKTAIAMAREQSRGLGVRFKQADVCNYPAGKPRTFDLAVDGHCLHCITRQADRKAFLRTVHRLLRNDGLFIVLTMCAPVDRKKFSDVLPTQKLIGRVIYVPYDRAGEYEGTRTVNGRKYLPTRHLGHWRSILTELRTAGFEPQLIRYNRPAANDPIGDLAVGALKVAR